ncbi:hypothetical protein [Mycobacterium sp.]|uniref:hypothetical protein n=1 Tax=Mycobacterium sp. TaxID=1785 RepID=UPI003F952F44
MLGVVHPVVGAAPPQQDSRADRRLAAGLVVLYGIELLALLKAAGVTGRLARAHPGHGAGLPALLVLAALGMVGWQACRLLRGRRSLNVSGLFLQAGILMTSIAVATQNLAAGLIGILLAQYWPDGVDSPPNPGVPNERSRVPRMWRRRRPSRSGRASRSAASCWWS